MSEKRLGVPHDQEELQIRNRERILAELDSFTAEDLRAAEDVYRRNPRGYLDHVLRSWSIFYFQGDTESFKAIFAKVLTWPFLEPTEVESWLESLTERKSRLAPALTEIWESRDVPLVDKTR